MKQLFALLFCVFATASVALVAQLPEYVPTDNLIGWYPLDAGDPSDYSGNGNDGVAENVTLESDRFGNLNGAVGLQGQNCCGQTDETLQHILVDGPLLNLGGNYTIACWFTSHNINKYQQCLFNTVPHTGVVVEYNNEHAPDVTSVGLGPGDAYWNTLYQHGPFSAYNEGQWYHVVFTKENNHYSLYVDGFLDWEATYDFAAGFDLDVGMRFGAIGGGHQIMNGAIDDCGIWNRSLSLSEIMGLYVGVPPDYGCMDSQACNFNPTATQDDGSCLIVDLGDDIETNEESVMLNAGPGFDSYLWNTGETTQSVDVFGNEEVSVEVGIWIDGDALSFDGDGDFLFASAMDEYNGLLDSFQPASTYWHNDFSISMELAIDIDHLQDIGLGTESFPGMQILSKGYSDDHSDDACNNPVEMQFFMEPGNQAEVSFIVYQENTTNSYYRVQANILDVFPDSDFHEIQVAFNDLDYSPGMDWGGPHHEVSLAIFRDGVAVPLTEDFDNGFSGMGVPNSPLFFGARVNDDFETCGTMDFRGELKSLKLDVVLNQWTEEILIEDAVDWDFNSSSTHFSGTAIGASQSSFFCSATDTVIVHFLTSGCMDPTACNYDPEATEHDGSCAYPPVLELGENIETCEGSVTLNAGEGFGSYLWSTGETSQSITVSESGLYTATVSAHPNIESSLSFDGVDDYVEVPNNESLDLDDFSVSFAIKTSASVAALIQKDANPEPIGGDWNIAMWDGQITANVRKQSGPESGYAILESLEPINDGLWHTVCMTRNSLSGVVALWVDGVLNQEGQGPIGTVSNNMDINFGRQNFNFTDYFNGWMDDIAIWNVVLSPGQIQQIVNCGVVGLESELAGRWSFEEGAGGVADDSSENENDATIHGASWSEMVPDADCSNCESSDGILVDLDNCDGFCLEGTIWNDELQGCVSMYEPESDSSSCVPAILSGDVIGDCTVMNLQELAQNHLLLVDQLATADSLLAICNGTADANSTWTCGDPVTYWDYDYATVLIGDQCWFAENLQTASYRNGDEIPYCANSCQWGNSEEGARSGYGDTYPDTGAECGQGLGSSGYCFAPTADVVALFGHLYNWHAIVDERKLCPSGWTVPSTTDFEDLIEIAEEAGTAPAAYLKADHTWLQENADVGLLGFDALAGGYGGNLGGFDGDGYLTMFWGSTQSTIGANAEHLQIEAGATAVFLNNNHKQYGQAVRCIKD